MTQLDELLAAAAAADAPLASALDTLRDATAAATQLVAIANTLQGEAQDAEFEDIPARTRAHLDGRLLQRTRFMKDRAADLSNRLRELAQGIRELRADCADLAGTLNDPVASGASPT